MCTYTAYYLKAMWKEGLSVLHIIVFGLFVLWIWFDLFIFAMLCCSVSCIGIQGCKLDVKKQMWQVNVIYSNKFQEIVIGVIFCCCSFRRQTLIKIYSCKELSKVIETNSSSECQDVHVNIRIRNTFFILREILFATVHRSSAQHLFRLLSQQTLEDDKFSSWII